MTYLYLYLLSQNFSLQFGFIAFLLLCIVGCIYLAKALSFKDNIKPPHKYLYWALFIFTTISTFLPNQQTLTYWGAFYVGKEVVQSEPVQKLYKILNEKLDNELKELTEAKSIK